MALSPIDRRSNLQDSIVKYFVDTLEKVEGLTITFDTSMVFPNTVALTTKKWVTFVFGDWTKDMHLNEPYLQIFCCTREDKEGFILSQLRDKVMGYLVDEDMPDGIKRVVMYQSSPTPPWTPIGGIMLSVEREYAPLPAPDGSKYLRILVRMRWGGK